MKTVWLLNHYAQEPGGPGGTRHFALARQLRELGWRVIIIASSVEHGSGRQRLDQGEKWRLAAYDGVEFLWLRGSSYHGNGGSRIRNMLDYTMQALRVSEEILPRPDAVIGSSVHPLAALAGQRLAKRFRVPFVFEVRDLWPETLIAMGRIGRGSMIARTMRGLEKFLYSRASAIITLLPNAVEYIAGLGIDPGKVSWLPNGVDVAAFDGSTERSRQGAFSFMYFGSHGIANGLMPIIEAFAAFRIDAVGTPVRLRLIGDGPEKAALQARAMQLELGDAVSFEDAVPKSDIPRLANQADAFVVNVLDLPLYRYGISLNKIFDYMAAGRPIVFAGNAFNNPVAEADAGICVPADNVQALQGAMRAMLAASPSERAAMGLNGRRHVANNFDYAQLAMKLATILDQVVASEVSEARP